MELRPEDDEIYKSLYRDQFNEFKLPATHKKWGYEKLPREVWSGIWIQQYDYVKNATKLRERMVRQSQTIHGVDRFIGQLRQQLDDLQLSDNTIIVFSTDHGIHFGEHGIGGKSLLYREDLHIPTIIYDPRLPETNQGQTRDELVVVPDLAPTVLELCNHPVPETMTGESLVPILRGDRVDNWRQQFFAENLFDHQITRDVNAYKPPNGSIRVILSEMKKKKMQKNLFVVPMMPIVKHDFERLTQQVPQPANNPSMKSYSTSLTTQVKNTILPVYRNILSYSRICAKH